MPVLSAARARFAAERLACSLEKVPKSRANQGLAPWSLVDERRTLSA
jgi:hypothetical protein